MHLDKDNNIFLTLLYLKVKWSTKNDVTKEVVNDQSGANAINVFRLLV